MGSSSSSSALAPSVSSQSWNYDVFLSFRGEDTRKNFVDHLYSALVQQGIHTYKDDETLRRGEWIGPSLMKAIEESQIAVIVFSENYANSSWCLDELTHIMKCKQRGQIVMPIFYNVDPSQVRKQKEKYGDAFVKHKLENKNKVESWRKALVDASNLSGWEPKNIANGHEAQAIKQIVEKISSRLHLVTSRANENLIGMASRMLGLRSQLQIGSGGVRMVGIWGIGGGGKTTLASCVYDEICNKFEGCCFLKNIREESKRHGLEALQEKILSKMGANNIGGGRSLINNRFLRRKVLLVFDDVDHLDQLEALAGSPDWFGEGSRVIITTRYEHLLNAHKVVVHNISLLRGDEAIKLFRKHAHLDYTSIIEDYDQLSEKLVSYASGLPLALKVLGSSLCDKDIEQWRSALARLKEIPDTNILEQLKISFDGLAKAQKDLFLDIACFFRHKKKDMAMEILDACGFDPVIGVEELRQKALITIDSDGMFDMHDLVQEMAHYIVRGEHTNNPEKHSRVWKSEDVVRICAMDATEELDMIEAIRFEVTWNIRSMLEGIFNARSSQVFPPIVANMKNLRWIHWGGDLANPLPTNFPPRQICCLILAYISQKKLWEGSKKLLNLKKMELREMNKLIVTPEFDGFPNLERFTLSGCRDLKEIHSSFENLDKIVSLRIEQCPLIKKFPSITRLKKLQTLSFKSSPGVFELSEPLIQKLFWWLPRNNKNHLQLCFPHIDLRNLNLHNCALGDEYMSSAVWELPNLQELDLSGNKFSRLNFSLLRLPRLKWLCVSYCSDLVELLELPSSIDVLEAANCYSLKSLGDITNCKWLWKVCLSWRFQEIPLVDGDMLLNSMLKGNAIEDHHISVALPYPIFPYWDVVGGLFRGNTFRLRLPRDWYSGFCGFLIHLVTHKENPYIDIVMKKEEEEEVDEDPPFRLWQESNQAPEPDKHNWQLKTYVGYVSFSWLRRNACFDPQYNLISFSLCPNKFNSAAASRLVASLFPREIKDDLLQAIKLLSIDKDYSGDGDCIGAALVPRKTKHHHPLQTTTDSSQFWDGEDEYWKTFSIQHDSNSSIKIEWRPYTYHNI